MKKIKKVIAILLVFTGIMALNIFADPPTPPNPGGSPVGNGDPVGAPIDGGLGFLFILCTGYGARKIYSINKHQYNEPFIGRIKQ